MGLLSKNIAIDQIIQRLDPFTKDMMTLAVICHKDPDLNDVFKDMDLFKKEEKYPVVNGMREKPLPLPALICFWGLGILWWGSGKAAELIESLKNHHS